MSDGIELVQPVETYNLLQLFSCFLLIVWGFWSLERLFNAFRIRASILAGQQVSLRGLGDMLDVFFETEMHHLESVLQTRQRLPPVRVPAVYCPIKIDNVIINFNNKTINFDFWSASSCNISIALNVDKQVLSNYKGERDFRSYLLRQEVVLSEIQSIKANHANDNIDHYRHNERLTISFEEIAKNGTFSQEIESDMNVAITVIVTDIGNVHVRYRENTHINSNTDEGDESGEVEEGTISRGIYSYNEYDQPSPFAQISGIFSRMFGSNRRDVGRGDRVGYTNTRYHGRNRDVDGAQTQQTHMNVDTRENNGFRPVDNRDNIETSSVSSNASSTRGIAPSAHYGVSDDISPIDYTTSNDNGGNNSNSSRDRVSSSSSSSSSRTRARSGSMGGANGNNTALVRSVDAVCVICEPIHTSGSSSSNSSSSSAKKSSTNTLEGGVEAKLSLSLAVNGVMFAPQEVFGLSDNANADANKVEHERNATTTNSSNSSSNNNGGGILDGLPPTDNDEECVVCLSEAPEVLLLPCRHMCVCRSCFLHIEKCPVCRASFDEYVKVIADRKDAFSVPLCI